MNKDIELDIFIRENGITDENVIYLMQECIRPVRKNAEKTFSTIKNMIQKAKAHDTEKKEEVIPNHYTSLKIEPIVFIHENCLNFCQGNIIKYLSRLGKKDQAVDELKKVFFYFDYLYHKNYQRTKSEF